MVLDDMGRTSHSHIISRLFDGVVYDTLTTSPAVVGLMLFWPMVQMGVALVAACLPTLRPLFDGFSPESVIHSIRSNLSLSSLRSKASFHYIKSNSSQTSNGPVGKTFPNEVGKQVETHIAGSKGPSHDLDQHELHEIKVQNDFTQSVERS